jgi:hypothetical protein
VSELLFLKGQAGLAPACEESRIWLMRKKFGATILVEPREIRNGAFFRKWFALVTLGWDYWHETVEPMEFKGQPVRPEFNRFRKDVTIMAGFYEPVVNLKGELRIEAHSISWAKMTEDGFTKLYDATIHVLQTMVFNGKRCRKWSETEIRSVSEQLEAFAA